MNRRWGVLFQGILWGWFLGISGTGAPFIHELTDGVLKLELPTEEEGWDRNFPHSGGDLLFADGLTLVAMREAGEHGTTVTISLDEKHPIPVAEQEAFIALALDRNREGQMDVWVIADRTWIAQEFRSPSERVIATQSFMGPYALAYLFWFQADGDIEEQGKEARTILERWGPTWTSSK